MKIPFPYLRHAARTLVKFRLSARMMYCVDLRSSALAFEKVFSLSRISLASPAESDSLCSVSVEN